MAGSGVSLNGMNLFLLSTPFRRLPVCLSVTIELSGLDSLRLGLKVGSA